MKAIRLLFRFSTIAFVLAWYGVDEFLLDSSWFYPFRLISYLNPARYFVYQKLSRGARLRKALETLGPIFVKFGQLLSTRADVLPQDMVLELAHLQDAVKPFASHKARAIISGALDAPIDQCFASFVDEPIASASIAQVHAATLLDGKEVVVKVLRPRVLKKIDSDLELLHFAARLAERLLPDGKRLRPKDIVKEFEITLHGELDLMREAANAVTMKRDSLQLSEVYIPTIYWSYCRRNVLVMERIHGLPIDEIAEIKKLNMHPSILADSVVKVFFKQLFEYNFFHGDMHPGNIFVNPKYPKQIAVVDFGITGSLTLEDRRYVAENLLAFFKRDYRRVAQLHIDSGWLDHDVNLIEFEAAIRTVSEPMFEKPLGEISMGQLMLNLFRIARSFRINIQPQLLLLQKSLFHVESLARLLNPGLDLWTSLQPYLERWTRDQVGPKALLKRIVQELPVWSEVLPEMPRVMYEWFTQQSKVSQYKQSVPVQVPQKKWPEWCLGFSLGLFVSSGVAFYIDALPLVGILGGTGLVSLVAGLLGRI